MTTQTQLTKTLFDTRIPLRNVRVQVGDLIQYQYQQGRDTRRVIEIVDGGAAFIVEGRYHIGASQITTHIPEFGDAQHCPQCAIDTNGLNDNCDFCGSDLVPACAVPRRPGIARNSQHPVLRQTSNGARRL
jgi:hypothetical protein